MTCNKERHAQGEIIIMASDIKIKVGVLRACEWCGREYKPTTVHNRFCALPCRQNQWKVSVEYKERIKINSMNARELRELQRTKECRGKYDHRKPPKPQYTIMSNKKTKEMLEAQRPHKVTEIMPPTMQFLTGERFIQAANSFLRRTTRLEEK